MIVALLHVFRSYLACRENEKVQDQMLDCKLGRGRHLSDKENVKLESKRKKSESQVRKSDMEYYASCIKTERSRWVPIMYHALQSIEDYFGFAHYHHL